jgi:hypothetical protein
MSDELKSCFKCKGNNLLIEEVYVKCNDCDLYVYAETPEEAIKAWNTRNADSRVELDVNVIKAVIKGISIEQDNEYSPPYLDDYDLNEAVIAIAKLKPQVSTQPQLVAIDDAIVAILIQNNIKKKDVLGKHAFDAISLDKCLEVARLISKRFGQQKNNLININEDEVKRITLTILKNSDMSSPEILSDTISETLSAKFGQPNKIQVSQELSLCPNCNCMTKKVCGKCRAAVTGELVVALEDIYSLRDLKVTRKDGYCTLFHDVLIIAKVALAKHKGEL